MFNKNKLFSIIILLMLAVFSGSVYAQFEPVDPDSNGFLNITSLENLRWISENDYSWSEGYELTNDINASDTKSWNDGKGFIPIGTAKNKFEGIFEGNGYTILNLYINRPQTDNVGLLGYTSDVTVSDINLINCDITGQNNVGALIGNTAYNETISNCSVSGNVKGAAMVGGLVGKAIATSNIIFSSARCSVQASLIAGGMVGINFGKVKYSYATGDVLCDDTAGGFIGSFFSDSIIHCYSMGRVQGTTNVGGFIGANDLGSNNILGSFWNLSTSHISVSAGGVGKTQMKMQMQSTFTDVGWNFENIWNMDSTLTINDGLPYLDHAEIYNPTILYPVDSDTNGYREVRSLVHLKWMSENDTAWAWQYELMNNIDATETNEWNIGDHDGDGADYDSDSTTANQAMGFKAIGTEDEPFTGEFVGNGFIIENIYINRQDTNNDVCKNIGLFGVIESDTVAITNLGLVDVDIHGCVNAGGFVSQLRGATIQRCYLTGNFTYSDSIQNAAIGGIAAILSNNAKVTDCYAIANFATPNYLAAGIAGLVQITGTENINNCYALPFGESVKAILAAEEGVGNNIVTGCFWDVQKTGVPFSEGGIPKTTDEMKTESTFSDIGWDFTDIWMITESINDGYPYLQDMNMSLPAFNLLEPANEATSIINRPTCRWNTTTGAMTYHLIIATDSNMTFPIVNEIIENDTSYTIENKLDDLTKYYWKVCATFNNEIYKWSEIWSFDTKDFIDTPILTSPLNEAVKVDLPVNCIWEVIEAAESYTIQIASDMDFTNLLAEEIVLETTFTANDLEEETVYFWRVNAIKGVDISEWSEVWSYTTVKYISQPELIDPVNDATDIALTPLLDWSNVDVAISYQLVLSEDMDFTNIVLDTNITASKFFYPKNLNDAYKYYWRVRAENETEVSLWTDTWSFTTIDIIDAPALLSPEDGKIEVAYRPAFDWSDVADADSYKIQVSENSDMTNKIIDEETIGSEFTAIEELEEGKTFYWHLASIEGDITSNWSEIWRFTTIDVINIPAQISPINTSKNNSFKPTFTWSAIDDASNYNIQISRMQDFSAIEINENISENTFEPTNDLKDKALYYWRVNASNEIETSEWSETWSFATSNLKIVSTEPVDSDGDGYREISILGHLLWISENDTSWVWKFELTNNIEAGYTMDWENGKGFAPIGNDLLAFSGTLDGRGFYIDSLYIQRPTSDNLGLIGFTSASSLITNLNIINSSVEGNEGLGILVGTNEKGEIINCSTSGTVKGNKRIGGLVGMNTVAATIAFSNSSCHITNNSGSGSDIVSGGLVGDNNGTIYSSYATGDVTGDGYSGGLVGTNMNGDIHDCYAMGRVIGQYNIAGFAGLNNDATIVNCFSTGVVTATSTTGGFLGENIDGTITNCFWDAETSGVTTGDLGTPKTTDEMKTATTFTDANWDLVDIWEHDEFTNNGYPYLREFVTAINEDFMSGNIEINIYPNPAENMITLSSEYIITSVKIFDINGSLIKTSNATSINIENLNSACYFILVETTDGFTSTKFIKK